MKKYVVTLSQGERSDLEGIVPRGSHRSQKVLNGLILLGCEEGKYQDKKAEKEDMSSADSRCSPEKSVFPLQQQSVDLFSDDRYQQIFVTQCKSLNPLSDKLLNRVLDARGYLVSLKATSKVLNYPNSGFDISKKRDSSIAGDMAPIIFSDYFPATKPLKTEV